MCATILIWWGIWRSFVWIGVSICDLSCARMSKFWCESVFVIYKPFTGHACKCMCSGSAQSLKAFKVHAAGERTWAQSQWPLTLDIGEAQTHTGDLPLLLHTQSKSFCISAELYQGVTCTVIHYSELGNLMTPSFGMDILLWAAEGLEPFLVV